MIAIEFPEFFLIVLKLLIFKKAAARDPREHPMLARLDLFPQFPLGKGLRIDKLDLDDLYLRAFLNLEGSGSPAAFLDHVGYGLDLRARIARFLVHLLNFLAIGKQLPFIQRLADFG